MQKISFCENRDFNNLIRFLKKNWPNKSLSFSNKNFFKWMYFNSTKKKFNFLTIKKNNKIKACIGLLLNRTKLKQVVWLTFWLVDKKKRDKINGIELINFLINNFKNSIIATSGLNLNTIPIYKILGFKIDSLNHYFIVNPYLKHLKLVNINKNIKPILKKNRYEILILKKINFLKQNLYLKKFQKLFFKNINYFIIKYQKHPIYDYEFYIIKNNKKIYGFFVGRICNFNKRKALRLVEYYGSTNHISFLKSNLYNLLKKKNFEYIDFYNLGIKKNFLSKAGFKKNNFSNKTIIPNYYQPFKKENVNILTAVWPKNIDIPIFKGDCDQDRPNF